MKTIIFLSSVIMIALVTFALSKPGLDSEEKIGHQLIAALQRGSEHEYSALFPSVADFHGLMMSHSELYGKNITEAAKDFQKQFDTVLSPAFRGSFDNIRRRGQALGVDWRTAKLVRVEVPQNVTHHYAVVPMTVTFSSAGKDYRLVIDKAMVMDGQWKITQYIRLEE